MRARGRRDGNHQEIVRTFRGAGMCVQDLGNVGGGVPDLLVGWRGNNFLVEVKDGSKPPSARELTAAQREWHATWGGSVIVAENSEDAVIQVMCAERRLRT